MIDYMKERKKYGHDRNGIKVAAWEGSKIELSRLNPNISLLLYKVYSFYEKLKEAENTDEIQIEELNTYLNNYKELQKELVED